MTFAGCHHCLLPTSGLFRNNSSRSETVLLNINDFGAKGDGFTDATKISGTIFAPQDPTVWDGLDVHKWLYFHGVKHLTLEGGGIIDGMGHQWWAQSCKRNESNAITFHKCKNLKVRNVTLVNSQQMHMAFTNCMHVAASRLTIIAPADSPNTDGIHISASTHVELKDVTIGTGDDCVSIVNNSSRIRINNIVCGPGHGISLGKSNTYAEVQDVIVNGAILFDTENGVRIKTWQGGSGFARKITFQDIWMYNVSNPIIIDQYYCDSRAPCLNQTSAVSIDNISFRGIRGTSATKEAIVLLCSESHPCQRLYMEDILLVSLSGIAKSLCWEAYGASSGLILPPSCISSDETIIRHDDRSNSNKLVER
ncbi:hypothetical protein DH2020_038265 [Rehmannia glutinosa]|uniref:Polygalacturonase n=1 Tax=Rehmannia glutinosa TaxID=99300 RepID=A0ABR0UZP7_REHGL